jgi:hypothetical protein
LDFRSFLDKEKRRAQILEQRTIDAEDGKAKSERARGQVDSELNRICAGTELPLAVIKLLREAWANVMFITSLKQGVESDEWRSCCATAKQLVWSVTATMDKDNRQRLLKLVPDLLQKLRTGLESISFSPFETTNLFKQLETVHLARLRGEPKAVAQVTGVEGAGAQLVAPQAVVSTIPESNASVAEVVVESSAATPTVQLVESEVISPAPQQATIEAAQPELIAAPEVMNSQPEEALATSQVSAVAHESNAEPANVSARSDSPISEFVVLNAEGNVNADISAPIESDVAAEEVAIAQSIKADSQHLALVNNITQGTWFEMQGEAGEKYRCRLAAIIRSVGKYIFVNRSGMKVAEENRESLAIALQTKRLTILDDGMLFDRALEAVIGTLRDQRNLS